MAIRSVVGTAVGIALPLRRLTVPEFGAARGAAAAPTAEAAGPSRAFSETPAAAVGIAVALGTADGSADAGAGPSRASATPAAAVGTGPSRASETPAAAVGTGPSPAFETPAAAVGIAVALGTADGSADAGAGPSRASETPAAAVGIAVAVGTADVTIVWRRAGTGPGGAAAAPTVKVETTAEAVVRGTMSGAAAWRGATAAAAAIA